MAETTISIKKYVLKYGLFLSLIWIVYSLICYLTDNVNGKNLIFSLIEILLHIGVIIFAFYVYKSTNGGFLKLSEALKIGIGIALIGGITAMVWNIALMEIIEPDMFDQMLEKSRNNIIEQNPEMTEDQIDESIAVVKKLNAPYPMSALIFISNTFLGFMISLIGGAIMQKNRDVF